MPVIETHNLRKSYRDADALRGVTIRVEPGQVYGLLGRNGAGKTTLVKILLGIVKPTIGTARLLDRPAGEASVRRRIGFLPEDHHFPEYHTGASLLNFYGELYGMSVRDRRQRMATAL